MSDRPLRADARRNRERVLNAAREAFAADGVTVPLDEIARRAGVGPGTVYRHFPTKEALFAAVIAEHTEDLVRFARTASTADDPGAAFFAFLERLSDTAATKKDLADALAGAGVDIVGAAPTAELNAALGVLLERAREVGAVRGDVGIAELTALLKGAMLALQGTGDDPALRERIFAVVRDGLRRG